MSFSSGAAAAMATTTGEYKANDKCRLLFLIYVEGWGKVFMNPLGKKKVCKHHKWKILLSEGLML